MPPRAPWRQWASPTWPPKTSGTLSGGERALAALARVLAQETPVLLLDEPTAALDIRHQHSVLAAARRRALGDGAVIVVLHDLSIAAAYADRIVLVSGGRIVADGQPADIFREDLTSVVFAHPVTVVSHPADGYPSVLPRRLSLPAPEVGPRSVPCRSGEARNSGEAGTSLQIRCGRRAGTASAVLDLDRNSPIKVRLG